MASPSSSAPIRNNPYGTINPNIIGGWEFDQNDLEPIRPRAASPPGQVVQQQEPQRQEGLRQPEQTITSSVTTLRNFPSLKHSRYRPTNAAILAGFGDDNGADATSKKGPVALSVNRTEQQTNPGSSTPTSNGSGSEAQRLVRSSRKRTRTRTPPLNRAAYPFNPAMLTDLLTSSSDPEDSDTSGNEMVTPITPPPVERPRVLRRSSEAKRPSAGVFSGNGWNWATAGTVSNSGMTWKSAAPTAAPRSLSLSRAPRRMTTVAADATTFRRTELPGSTKATPPAEATVMPNTVSGSTARPTRGDTASTIPPGRGAGLRPRAMSIAGVTTTLRPSPRSRSHSRAVETSAVRKTVLQATKSSVSRIQVISGPSNEAVTVLANPIRLKSSTATSISRNCVSTSPSTAPSVSAASPVWSTPAVLSSVLTTLPPTTAVQTTTASGSTTPSRPSTPASGSLEPVLDAAIVATPTRTEADPWPEAFGPEDFDDYGMGSMGSVEARIQDNGDETESVASFQDDSEETALALPERPGHFTTEDLCFGQRYQQVKATPTNEKEGTEDGHSSSTSNPPISVVITNQRLKWPLDEEQDIADTTRECIVCTDSKDISQFPEAAVTKACKHLPTTCLECVATSIRSDLNSRLWNEIRCPECAEFLQYDDVERFADEETKERYQTLSFRYAISEAENFIWCTAGCGYGQVHDGGAERPIVTCLLCGHRSCYHHKVAWHVNLACEEYDALLADPANFQSRYERENEAAEEEVRARRAQEDADRAFAQLLMAAEQQEVERERERAAERERNRELDREAEQARERERLEETERARVAEREAREREERDRVRREREERERAERERVERIEREIRERVEREEQERVERERREREEKEARVAEGRRMREEAQRRKEEEEASSRTVGMTTKPCPGCQAPIEKNAGCAHMKCINCKHEFCWDCLADHKKILMSDNSVHQEICPWHPNNMKVDESWLNLHTELPSPGAT